ncbi:MAG: hypothetical protein ABEL76_05305 [Bradymonadaceae bacterium]
MRISIVVTGLAAVLIFSVGCGSDATGANRFGLGDDAGADAVGEPDGQTPDTEPDAGIPDATPDTEQPDPDTSPDTGLTDVADSGGMDVRDTVDGGDDTGPSSQFGPGSFLRTINIDPSCCRDFDNDRAIDNELGRLITQFSSLTGTDINANIKRQIQTGQLVFLFKYRNWSNPLADPSLAMSSHPGSDADMATFQDNLMGTGTFLLDSNSFDSNGDPKTELNDVKVEQKYKLRASGGMIQLTVPFGMGISFTVRIKDPRVRAKVKKSATVKQGGRVPLKNGRLSGAVPKADIFKGLNAAGSACSCLSGKKLFKKSQGGNWTCNAPRACNSAQLRLCQPTICSLAGGQLNRSADLDTDAQPGNDAYSFGIRFRAVGAEIVGIAP